MKLLSIETSQSIGSVAVVDGESLSQLEIETAREQTVLILPVIHQLLREAGLELGALDAIVIGYGPGSFTGLRVAAAVAQGLALAAGLRIVPVSSMAGMAERARREHGSERVLTCIDARMGEVYWGSFEVRGNAIAAIGSEQIGLPEDVVVPEWSAWAVAGNAISRYPSKLAHLLAAANAAYPDLHPFAEDLIPLARIEIAANRSLRPEEVRPSYLRQASAWKQGDKTRN